jgi:hypothetical protein
MSVERWQSLGFYFPSKEAYSGIISGFGLGIMIAQGILLKHPSFFLNVAATWCIVGGSMWGRALQRKRLEENKADKEAGNSN